MKRFVVAGLIAITLGLLAYSLMEKKKTLVFVANSNGDFWKAAAAGIKSAQEELPNYKLVFKFPSQPTAEAQIDLMNDLTASGTAGIMVSVIDPKASSEALNRISGKLALFTTNSDAPETGRIAYIGSANADAGKQAGELVLKALPDGGKCMGFVGLPDADNAKERIQGVKDAIAGSNVELVDVRVDNIDHALAKRNVEDTLATNPDINCMIGIVAYEAPIIYGVLTDSGKLGKIKIIGFDANPVTLGGIQEGAIVGSVVQQPYQWAYYGMIDMAKYLDGDKSFIPENKLIIVPTLVVDQSNVGVFWENLKMEENLAKESGF